jgi:hypothetical protein
MKLEKGASFRFTPITDQRLRDAFDPSRHSRSTRYRAPRSMAWMAKWALLLSRAKANVRLSVIGSVSRIAASSSPPYEWNDRHSSISPAGALASVSGTLVHKWIADGTDRHRFFRWISGAALWAVPSAAPCA